MAITGYYYAMRDQPDFGVGVAALDRGPLHLEARYNYEARNATSVFAGWKFAGGDELTFEVTPIVGGLFGAARGIVPGAEASVAWRDFDAYIEAEYVRDLEDASASYYLRVERARLETAAAGFASAWRASARRSSTRAATCSTARLRRRSSARRRSASIGSIRIPAAAT